MIEILDYVFGIRFCPIKAAQDNMLDKRTRASARFGGEYPLGRHRLMGLFQHYWIHIIVQIPVDCDAIKEVGCFGRKIQHFFSPRRQEQSLIVQNHYFYVFKAI